MSLPLPLCIASTGYHLPPRVQTAEELAPLLGVSAEWIRRRTGVGERRIAEEDLGVLGARAARAALGSGSPPDLVLNCGLSPAQLIPDTSVFFLKELGLSGIPSFSIHATCLGFLAALQTATGLLQTGLYQRILVVAAERGTQCRDLSHPESAALIGDAAAAAVLTREGASRLRAFEMRTVPEGASLARIEGFGSRHPPDAASTEPIHNRFRMEGPRIYRLTARVMQEVLGRVLAQAGLTLAEVDLIVPHQASGPALALLERWGVPADRTVNILGQAGNCIAASLPLALAMAAEKGRLKRGDTVLLLGTGAGLSVAAAVLDW